MPSDCWRNCPAFMRDSAVITAETAYATGTGSNQPRGLITGLAAVPASAVARPWPSSSTRPTSTRVAEGPAAAVPGRRVLARQPVDH
jgi:hypothetical protein